MNNLQGPEYEICPKSNTHHTKDEEIVNHEKATVMDTQVADLTHFQTEIAHIEKEMSVSCSKIMLTDVFSKGGRPFKCCCIIDEQSSCSFIPSELASYLDDRGQLVDYSRSTMSKICTKVDVISALSIKRVNESETYRLLRLLTSLQIPNCVDEIATPKLSRSISQTQRFASNFLEKDSSASVIPLLGRGYDPFMST